LLVEYQLSINENFHSASLAWTEHLQCKYVEDKENVFKHNNKTNKPRTTQNRERL